MSATAASEDHHDAGLTPVLAVVSAGTARDDADSLDAAVAAWRAQGREVQVAVTDGAAELTEALGALDGRRLVLLGGDGSIHAIVGSLHAAGRLEAAGPVGIVPLGTGNDLAQSLRLPVGDVEGAARVAVGASTAPMDLLVRTSPAGRDERAGSGAGVTEDDEDDEDDAGWYPRVAVNAVHAGIGVAASERAEGLKPRWGAAAYPLGAVAAGAGAPARRLAVRVDDEVVHDGDEPLVMVTLSLGSTIGGGAPIAPGASPHDGRVRVVVSASDTVVARAGYAVDVLRGRQRERGDVRAWSGRRVSVEDVDGEPFVMDVDGDLSAAVAAVAWEVRHPAWTAAVPEGSG